MAAAPCTHAQARAAPTACGCARRARRDVCARRQDVFEMDKLSEARLQATRNIAQCAELMAKAEGVAAPYVEARKQFETRQKQMKVWESLARNKDLVVSGEENPELNAILLSDAIMGDKPADGTKSQVLAEMLVMQRGSKVMLNLAKDADGA